MKQTPLRKVSQKKAKILREEAEARADMMARYQGCCMLCGRFGRLEKNHTRDRTRFVMSCLSCHSPGGVHRYLDDEETKL